MSKYYRPQPDKNLYDLKKLRNSPEQIEADLFINCPRCFYLTEGSASRNLRYPFTLNAAVDIL